jgi:rsbT co-antagonist protein RsbR
MLRQDQGRKSVAKKKSISEALTKRRAEIQSQWSAELTSSISSSAKGRLTSTELNEQAKQFLDLFNAAVHSQQLEDIGAPEWAEVRGFLDELSKRRVLAGFSSDETATFIFSLKRAVFDALKKEYGTDAMKLADATWQATLLIDKLGLHTVKSYQKTREEVISRQQLELLELSTPVVKLWDGILALPMIGTLDSARTQVVMESLLQKIVETESPIAIIDITGVPTVDTLVAQHLLKTVTAIRLMGADCIISGVRPQIAQTIVHLGVDLQGVTTKANLADALALALKRNGIAFVSKQ